MRSDHPLGPARDWAATWTAPSSAGSVDLPVRPWPVVVVTLKNRTRNPAAELFIEHIRNFTTHQWRMA